MNQLLRLMMGAGLGHLMEMETQASPYPSLHEAPRKRGVGKRSVPTTNSLREGYGGRMPPSQYVENLTPSQRAKQIALLAQSKKDYKKGKVEDRPTVSDAPTKRSKHVIRFEKRYGFPITDKKRLKETFPDTDIDGILSKGAGAYGSSGSRPNVSIAQWSYARLASVLTAGKSLRIDKDLVGPISMRKINAD